MDDYVKSIQEGLKESKRFFSNASKQYRELWVLREFLSYLPIKIVNSDRAPATQEPHDVVYGPYGFQVKEVLSEGRRRGKEYSDKLEVIQEDTEPKDLLETYSPINISLNEALPRVASELARHRKEKYSNQTAGIDVLVYLNLSDTTYTSESVISLPAEFSNWQSVSLVSNNCAIVLACSNEGNKLLQPHVNRLYVKKLTTL